MLIFFFKLLNLETCAFIIHKRQIKNMLRCTRFQVCNLIEKCKISEVLRKSLTLENRLYHRQSLFEDDDYPFDDKQSYKKDKRFWNSNKIPNYRSEVNSFYKNKGYANRNGFTNKRQGLFPNQNFGLRRNFEQELDRATFNEKDLTPINKFLYVEHSDVTERTMEEVESFKRNSNISVIGSDIPKPITNFHELCLPEELKKVILKQEYCEPTSIQAQGWPIALSGKDMVGISQTGSGKTLVFMIPAIIHALNQPDKITQINECSPQVLVLAPTRELVQQIFQVSSKFCDACHLISSCAYGGSSKNLQLQCLKGCHVCIATPGRLIDFISEGSVSLKKCTYLVLDEADRMLDMGFEPQIRQIIGQIRPDRQTLMWSATWPREIQNLAEDFLKDYVKVTVGDGQLVANPNIEQNIYILDEMDKEERLLTLLEGLTSKEGNKVLVFAQTKRMVDYLGTNLNRNGIKSMVIHGDVSQAKRDHALSSFRKMKNCVLIATDVAARGLDITDVQHVINYDFPLNIEDYIHRIGRTARGRATGVAHSFFTSENIGVVKDLITVLKQAKQNINPELYALAEKKFQNRGHSKSFNRRRYQSYI